MGLSIDPTSFLHDEVKKAKIKLEKALKRGNSLVAAKQAKRVAELLRELARYKRVGGKELLDLAEELGAAHLGHALVDDERGHGLRQVLEFLHCFEGLGARRGGHYLVGRSVVVA